MISQKSLGQTAARNIPTEGPVSWPSISIGPVPHSSRCSIRGCPGQPVEKSVESSSFKPWPYKSVVLGMLRQDMLGGYMSK